MNLQKKKIILLIFLISCCLQNLVVKSFGNFGFKTFHIISLFFIFPLLNKKSLKFPPKSVFLLFIYFFTISLININIYGFNSVLFNYIFSFYILIIILNYSEDFKKEDWNWILNKASWIVLIIVVGNAFLNLDNIKSFLKAPNGHPVYDYIFGGGANLEATWIGLFAFLLKNDKKGYIYNTICTLISAVLASRVGLICNALCYIYYVFYGRKNLKKDFQDVTIIIILGIITILVAMIKFNIFDYILERFSIIGKDPRFSR